MKKLFLFAVVGLFLITLDSGSLEAQFLPASSHAVFLFAHLADGGPQSDKWKTVFRVVNTSGFTQKPVSGTLWFYDPQGNPLPLDFGYGAVTSLPVTIPCPGCHSAKDDRSISGLTDGLGFG